jgi:hypothetical protein
LCKNILISELIDIMNNTKTLQVCVLIINVVYKEWSVTKL